jgi:hypothetical protein
MCALTALLENYAAEIRLDGKTVQLGYGVRHVVGTVRGALS